MIAANAQKFAVVRCRASHENVVAVVGIEQVTARAADEKVPARSAAEQI